MLDPIPKVWSGTQSRAEQRHCWILLPLFFRTRSHPTNPGKDAMPNRNFCLSSFHTLSTSSLRKVLFHLLACGPRGVHLVTLRIRTLHCLQHCLRRDPTDASPASPPSYPLSIPSPLHLPLSAFLHSTSCSARSPLGITQIAKRKRPYSALSAFYASTRDRFLNGPRSI